MAFDFIKLSVSLTSSIVDENVPAPVVVPESDIHEPSTVVSEAPQAIEKENVPKSTSWLWSVCCSAE